MKKILSAALASLMLMGGSAAVFAEDTAAETASALTLAESSHLKLDRESGYVDMIDGAVTVAELKANFASDVTVSGADGTAKADDAAVATDDVVAAGEESLKALIYGDVDRNGKINLTDVTNMLKDLAGWAPGINADAADVDATGKFNLSDASKMMKYLAGWDDISLGNVRWVFENVKLTAENEDSGIDLFFESPLVKLGRTDTESTGEFSYKLKLAKNETESCQFFLVSDETMEGMTVELTPFEHEYGEGTLAGELLLHFYYKFDTYSNVLKESGETVVKGDLYPEPLLSLADSFELTAERSQGFHINVTTDENTPAGMYKAVLTVKDAAGNEIKQANVYTYVWDFTLPVTPYSASAFSINWYTIHTSIPNLLNGDDSQTYARYYEFLLDNNVTAYTMPYKITDPRADAYMSDPRVTYFTITGGDNNWPTAQTDEETVAFYNKVMTNEVWADKGAFYLVDEPYGESGAQIIAEKYAHLTELLGTDDYQVIMPHGNTMADLANNIDMLDFLTDYVDIFVPGPPAFQLNFDEEHYNELFWTPRPAYAKYGESRDRLHALKYEQGKKLWWYVCVGPSWPYPNLTLTHQGVMNRVIWWQQFMYDVDGFLYWSVNADWSRLPWENKGLYDYPEGAGDGNLIYYGERYGRTGPVLGWRFVQVRDGFDDFDYLRMAEELVGTDEVMKVVNKLTTGITYVIEDAAVMEACRNAVAELIVENQAK